MRRKVPWVHTKLSAYTTGDILNCVHTAVTASHNYWETFMSWEIPLGMTARIIINPVMQFKIYASGGEELGRSVQLMLSLQRKGKATPTEIYRFPYSLFYDISWGDQLNREWRESLTINIPYTETLFWEGEKILLQLINSTIAIPASPHASTLLQFDIQVIDNADVKRERKAEQDQESRAKGIDAD